ncbi:MAG: hypothetical protein KDD61_00945 [Bdellovibrionales bacterium]|nr:hypothetical protein [Bdellovibrionales bacterium]
MKVWWFLFWFVCVLPVQADQFFFGPSLSYRSLTVTQGSVATEASVTLMDARVGMMMSNSFAIGGLYSQIGQKTGATSETRSNLGASVGFMGESALLYFTYFISSQYEQSASTLKGTGLQVDFAYHFKLSNFKIGPLLSYKQFHYTTSESSGTESSMDRKDELVEPYISFLFLF